jgi:hypothetical protein
MPLGVEAINEDLFDLDELEVEELEQLEGAAGSAAASVASSAFYSTIREVSLGYTYLACLRKLLVSLF